MFSKNLKKNMPCWVVFSIINNNTSFKKNVGKKAAVCSVLVIHGVVIKCSTVIMVYKIVNNIK